MKILNDIILQYLKEDVLDSLKFPLTTVSDVLAEDTLDYDEQSVVIQNFIDNLTIYTHTDLGTSDSNILVDFSTNVFANYFVANVNTTPEYLLCYTINGNKIDLVVPLENFTP